MLLPPDRHGIISLMLRMRLLSLKGVKEQFIIKVSEGSVGTKSHGLLNSFLQLPPLHLCFEMILKLFLSVLHPPTFHQLDSRLPLCPPTGWGTQQLHT